MTVWAIFLSRRFLSSKKSPLARRPPRHPAHTLGFHPWRAAERRAHYRLSLFPVLRRGVTGLRLRGPCCFKAGAIVKRFLGSHRHSRESRIQVGAPQRLAFRKPFSQKYGKTSDK